MCIRDRISQTAKKAEDIARNILTQDNTFFSQMGMFYLGPIDGHDVETLVKVLKNLNDGSQQTIEQKNIFEHFKSLTL